MSETNWNQSEKKKDKLASENHLPEGNPSPGRSTMKILRENPFVSARKTLAFIEQSEKDPSIKIRVEDRPSAALLSIGLILFGLVLAFLGMPSMKSLCGGLAILADLTIGLAAFWFVLVRIGVLRVLDARYALVCFQLLLGSGVLFAIVAVNITLALVPLLEYLNRFYSK